MSRFSHVVPAGLPRVRIADDPAAAALELGDAADTVDFEDELESEVN